MIVEMRTAEEWMARLAEITGPFETESAEAIEQIENIKKFIRQIQYNAHKYGMIDALKLATNVSPTSTVQRAEIMMAIARSINNSLPPL